MNMKVGSVLSGPVDERRIGSLPQVTVVGDGAAVVGDGAASENAVSMLAHGCRRRRYVCSETPIARRNAELVAS